MVRAPRPVLRQIRGHLGVGERGDVHLAGLQGGEELVAGQRDQLHVVVLQARLLQRPQQDDALRLALREGEPLAPEVLDRPDVAAGLGGEEVVGLAGHVDRDDPRVEALVVRLDRRDAGVVGDLQGLRAEGVDDIGPGTDVQPVADTVNGRIGQLGQSELELLGVLVRGDLQAGPRGHLLGQRGGRGALAAAAALPSAQPLSPATPAAAPSREVRKSRRSTPAQEKKTWEDSVSEATQGQEACGIRQGIQGKGIHAGGNERFTRGNVSATVGATAHERAHEQDVPGHRQLLSIFRVLN